MRVRSWTGSAALVLLALLAVAGCAERRDPGGPITLVFKHAKLFGPADPIPRLLREFEANHPGVTVRSEELTWTSDEQHQFTSSSWRARRRPSTC